MQQSPPDCAGWKFVADRKTKKAGRPPRVPGERLERVAINLRRSAMLALELIARDRDTSLSQAAEFVLTTTMRSYLIDGEPLEKTVNKMLVMEESKFGEVAAFNAHDGVQRSPEEIRAVLAKFADESRVFRVLFMPSRLRTSEERYLLEVFEAADAGYWTQGALLARLAAEGFRDGVPASEVAAEWVRQAKLENQTAHPST
ncbi:hypothetical protein [Tahibacter harae]|nr:hypothetical protein [Tahibacter harae]